MSAGRVREWPAAHPPGPEERIETRCPSCRTWWRIHQDMAGFRLRCECGVWIPVPAVRPAELRGPSHALTRELQAKPAVVVPRHPLPDPRRGGAPGSLSQADLRTRQAWTSRSLLELAAIVVALAGPATLVQLLYSGSAAAAAMPVASLVSGIAVLVVCALTGPYAFAGLRDARPLRYAEALFVALGSAGLALAWRQWLVSSMPDLADPVLELRQSIGLGWALFVFGLSPALFEELAFRGLLQGRLMALLGRTTGILVTAAAFALAHGVTVGFPFHLGLGLYLGYLRERSGSLYPGMLAHFAYNSTLVILVGGT